MDPANEQAIRLVLAQAKKLAQRYYRLTGKPLGITGEVAEYEAAQLLGLTLTPARNAGHDATECVGRRTRLLQIKGRCVRDGFGKSERLSKIDPTKAFDAVLVVVLDEALNAVEIWEAPRDAVLAALARPGSKARNQRGQLGLNSFKRIARLRYSVADSRRRR